MTTELVSHNKDELTNRIDAWSEQIQFSGAEDIADGVTFMVTRPRHASPAWPLTVTATPTAILAGVVDRIVAEKPNAADEPEAFCSRVGAVLEHELAALLAAGAVSPGNLVHRHA